MNAIGIVTCLGFVALLMGAAAFARWRDGRRSGWTRLGHRYPVGPRRSGMAFARTSVRVNGRWYRDTADVGIGGGGIHVRLALVFCPYHRPLLLPWDDVTAADADVINGAFPLAVGDAATVLLTGPAAAAAARVLARRRSRDARSV